MISKLQAQTIALLVRELITKELANAKKAEYSAADGIRIEHNLDLARLNLASYLDSIQNKDGT